MFRAINFIIVFAALLAYSPSYGQDEINISDNHPTNYTITCVDPITLTDSNANDGDYAPGENFEVTFCVDESSETNPQIVISSELYGHIWDVDENSSLFVYDGENTSSTLLGVFNSVNSPSGINVQGSNPCLTIVFNSGATSSGAGFSALIQCFQPFQDFDFTLSGSPPIEPFQDLPEPAIQICFG